jgi:hypothetical protein
MADTAGYPTEAKLASHNAHMSKRKRDTRDQGLSRPAPNSNTELADQVTAATPQVLEILPQPPLLITK